jgi:hypothetical protein
MTRHLVARRRCLQLPVAIASGSAESVSTVASIWMKSAMTESKDSTLHSSASGSPCTERSLDRHEVGLRSDTIGFVWWMRWHERRRDWGWLS